GDGEDYEHRGYATPMVIPEGKTPKMIGMTQATASSQTYYMLATDGNLYGLGHNYYLQLGTWNNADSKTWVQPKKPNEAGNASSGQVFDNVVWISPNEHDGYGNAAINVLTFDKKQYAWGNNNFNMLGNSCTYCNPMFMPGSSTDPNGLSKEDNVIAVETGGNTTMNILEGSLKFGYVGHKA